jgi:thiol-disulfide isomerase/thioredoxin
VPHPGEEHRLRFLEIRAPLRREEAAIEPGKVLTAAVAGCAVVAALAGIADVSDRQVAAKSSAPGALPSRRASSARDFPSLAGATGWINSAPLTPESLRGKVVLIDFWTFTCINWRRELPYVRAWAEKYKGQGLVVIGVHTPEFEFEKEEANIRRAAKDIAVPYPIAIDSDRKIWRAFANQYWPALYFIDAKGVVRHHHFGEGDYEESERVLQRLLVEAGGTAIGTDLVDPVARGAEAAPDWKTLGSGENYLGYARTENFDSPGGVAADKRRDYAVPARLRTNHWGLAGEWTMKAQATALSKGTGRIAYAFHARDLHLVMGSATPGSDVRFRVLIDGQPPGPAAGADVDALGNGVVHEQRMYHLIRQQGPVRDRRFEIEFLDPGVEAFSVTFG